MEQAELKNERVNDKIDRVLRKGLSKTELAEYLELSRPTLNRRIEKENWKRGEIELLRKLDK